MAAQLTTRRLALALAGLIFCVVSHAVFAAVYRAANGSVDVIRFIFDEDNLVETLGAIAFLAAGVLAVHALFVRPPEVVRDRIALGVIAVIGIFGFLDEVSFGDRIFALDLPVIAGVRIDGVHDFFGLWEWIRWELIGPIPDAAKLPIVGVGGAIALGAAWTVWRYRRTLFDDRAAVVSFGMLALALVVLGEAVVAFVIDNAHDTPDIGYSTELQAIEEVAELNIAVLAVFAFLMIRRTTVMAGNRDNRVRVRA